MSALPSSRCCFGTAPARGAEAFTDDAGRRIEIGAPARRIVTLAPHLAELAFAAGAGAYVVGVSSYTDWPDAARRLPEIAASGQVDLERLVIAKPDLVLTWTSGVPAQENARIERLGYRVVSVEIRKLEDVAVWLRRIGDLAGTAPAAQAAAAAYERDLKALVARNRGRPSVPTFYEIWNDPLMTLSGSHLVSQSWTSAADATSTPMRPPSRRSCRWRISSRPGPSRCWWRRRRRKPRSGPGRGGPIRACAPCTPGTSKPSTRRWRTAWGRACSTGQRRFAQRSSGRGSRPPGGQGRPLLLSSAPMVPDAVDLASIRRVLVIKLRHHGDVLLTSPVFSALKAAAPHAALDALVYDDTRADADAASGHPHGCTPSAGSGGACRCIAGSPPRSALVRRLAAERYDLVVHLTDSPRGAALARLLKPRWSVAPDEPSRGKLWKGAFTHRYKLTRTAAGTPSKSNLDALRRIGLQPGDGRAPPGLVGGRRGEADVQSRLAALGLAEARTSSTCIRPRAGCSSAGRPSAMPNSSTR